MEQLLANLANQPASDLTVLIAFLLLLEKLVEKGYLRIRIGRNGNGGESSKSQTEHYADLAGMRSDIKNLQTDVTEVRDEQKKQGQDIAYIRGLMDRGN